MRDLLYWRQRPAGDLPLLTPAEQHQVLVEWNNTYVDYSQGWCLHQRFEAQVQQAPEAIALVCGEEQITYYELNCQANRLGHYLRAAGVGPELCAGLCAERSIDLAAGMLGILKAGGVCVPLDPGWPAERSALVIDDTRLVLLLTQHDFLDDFAASPVPQVCFDRDHVAIATYGTENPDSQVAADNAALVLYTSGSTGAPKGVVISHRSECSWQMPETAPYQLAQEDRFLITGYSAMGDMFWPWFSGARVVLARDDVYQDSAGLVRLIAEQQVTFAYFVPAMLQVVLDDARLGWCTSLRRVRCGGEPLAPDLQERFFTRLDATLHNYYALTEAGTILWDCTGDTYQGAVPIGRPAANTQVYLLDAHGQPVPIGVPGELYLGGLEMARGYLNRPDLTAERFLPNSFADQRLEIGDWRLSDTETSISNLQSLISSGTRLYKTGDLARYLPDGKLMFMGRTDSQVKIRGFRVELGEIEVALRQHPAVGEAVALVREDGPGEKRLIAYVVQGPEARGQGSGEQPPDFLIPAPRSLIPELRAYLKERLPDYMVPAAFVALSSIPRTPSGKVDRRRLPPPERVRPDLETPFVVPRTVAETVVARVWAQALGIEDVGIRDNFFALGGHSLMAIQMLSSLHDIFQVELPLRGLFESPTVEGVINALAQIWGGPETVEDIAQTYIELEQLSEEQLAALLQEAQGEPS